MLTVEPQRPGPHSVPGLDRIMSHTSLFILEDEALLTMTLQKCAQQLGVLDIAIAMSLAQGNEILAKRRFDFALLDISLPDGTSLAIARALIEQGTEVMFHSGHIDTALINEFPNCYFCEKPTSMPNLRKVLSALMSRSIADRHAFLR